MSVGESVICKWIKFVFNAKMIHFFVLYSVLLLDFGVMEILIVQCYYIEQFIETERSEEIFSVNS